MTNESAQINIFQKYISNSLPNGSKSIVLGNIYPKYIRVNHPETDWSATLNARFNELTALPVGWDGYNGIAVLFTTAQFAANLLEQFFDENLPPPNLVPGSDGSIQIEWHINQYDIEIDVLSANKVDAMRYDCLSGHTDELSLNYDFTALSLWIKDLLKDRSANKVA